MAETTTEYAILLGFLAIAIIIALFFLGASCAASSRARLAASPGLRARPEQTPGLVQPAPQAGCTLRGTRPVI